MTKRSNETMIEYAVRIPAGRARELEKALQRAGFEFHRDQNMIAIARDVEAVIGGVTSGDGLLECIESLNNLIDIHGERPRMRTDVENWSHEERYATLVFAKLQLSALGAPRPAPWWIAEGRDWQRDIVALNPALPWEPPGE